MQVGKFLLGLFLDDDGAPSFSRMATAVILAFSLGWVTRVVLATNQLPDMLGLAAFLTALYGSNVLASAIDRGPKA